MATLWFIALTFGIMALLSLPISRLVPGTLRPRSPLEAALGPVERLLRPLIHVLPRFSPPPKEGSSLTVAFAPHSQAGGQSPGDANGTGGGGSSSEFRPIPVPPLNGGDIPRRPSGRPTAADRKDGKQAQPPHRPGHPSNGNHGSKGSGHGHSKGHHHGNSKEHGHGHDHGHGH